MKVEKSIKFRRLIVILALPAFFLLITLGQQNSYALSIEEEKELGQQFLDQVRKDFEFEDDDSINEYINDLGKYLTSSLDTVNFPFHFYVIKDNTLNAFAGPGGNIFIFSGMIESLDEVDELAAVICHELAHVSARHLSERIEQNKKIGFATIAGVLAGSLLGGKAAEAILTSSLAAGAQIQLNYSRDDERQADQLGFQYMINAGFNPERMVSVLKKIQQKNYIGSESATPYLLTHPGGSERMANIDSMMTNFSSTSTNKPPEKYEDHFPIFKTILEAKNQDQEDSINFFHRELNKNPHGTLAHLGLGIVYMEKAEYETSIDHFEKALSDTADRQFIYRYLGQSYHLMGKDLIAIEFFNRALSINRVDKSALYMKALSFQDIGKYSDSIHILEKLSSMEPVKNDVFYNLGVSYGRSGKLDLAHYNFGIFFKKQGEIEKASFHFEKAAELSRGNPSLLDRIQKEQEDLKKATRKNHR